MKYSVEESLQQIRDRTVIRIRKKAERARNLLVSVSAMLLLTLTAVMHRLAAPSAGLQTGSSYGSYLLPPENGGYFLVAVVFFALGAAVVLLVRRKKHTENRLEPDSDERENE